jgi:hypothetical protein
MNSSQPYREPPSIPHRQPEPPDPTWRRYRRSARLYNLVLGALLLGFFGMAFVDPVALPGLFLLLMHALFAMFAWVRRYRCPSCQQSLISGSRAPSAWALTFGVFPGDCTHCGATPEPPQCECSGCRASTPASS